MVYNTEYKSGMKMKIPTGGSGNGYYGHESSVISYLDNVESDADVPATAEDDFSEYMWMENEEEFDKQVLQQLEEEELMEECLEAMLEEERQHERNQTSSAWCTATSTENNGAELCQQLNSLRVHDDIAKQSTLNPNAAEFVPTFKLSAPPEISAKSS
ncbi:PREDICTED: polyadenylate-binding protein-interacting protein 2 isoform X1 [Ceratosolen solmsi marchali]|uniref:Polyadenylate-binding protein-interacting protein 2 isoform X1 n=2 Tax=Ceratosolen solmsi marchali TaxID=326594 RepID=A0AAJ6YPU2_9HYME|nr:PREDICTED: polyadenylate-binding protein-interacting protein 2 isoform X1 [Ceratosolen solmsi marchali]